MLLTLCSWAPGSPRCTCSLQVSAGAKTAKTAFPSPKLHRPCRFSRGSASCTRTTPSAGCPRGCLGLLRRPSWPTPPSTGPSLVVSQCPSAFPSRQSQVRCDFRLRLDGPRTPLLPFMLGGAVGAPHPRDRYPMGPGATLLPQCDPSHPPPSPLCGVWAVFSRRAGLPYPGELQDPSDTRQLASW